MYARVRAAQGRLLAAVVLTGSLVVAVPAASSQSAGGTVTAQPTQSRADVGAPIQWKPCGPPESLQCARIRVPLDWDRPNGRTIGLSLIRHLASKPDERIGTLFINPGGPGDTGVGLVRGDPEGIDAIGGGRFDVVSWDTRGTQSSTPG